MEIKQNVSIILHVIHKEVGRYYILNKLTCNACFAPEYEPSPGAPDSNEIHVLNAEADTDKYSTSLQQ